MYLCCSLAVEITSKLKRVTRIIEAVSWVKNCEYIDDKTLAVSKFQGVCGQVIVTKLRVVFSN